MRRLILGLITAGLLSLAATFVSVAARAQALQPDGAGVQRGVLPDRWIVTGVDCPPNPKFQVHEYNRDLVILRESACSNYEKPFLYLIFGKSKVLMLDTGAGRTDVAQVVQDVIAGWLKRNGPTLKLDTIPLVVAHTHAHGDHISGDAALKLLPNTTVVALKPPDVQTFFGFKNWPEDIVTFDLGSRTLDVIAIPGHEASSIAVYDRQTGILFTGDTLYPGRLYVADNAAYTRSIQRLVDFTRGKIVTHLLGNHIEQARTPFLDYPIGTKYQPDEHALELDRSHLLELNEALGAMNGSITRTALRDFTIWPKTAPAPLPTVIAAEVPQYPDAALKAGVSGTVRMTATTDGEKITDVRIVASGGPASPLGEVALANVRTWRFEPHQRTTFDVSFRFVIASRACGALASDAPPAVIMRFPTSVELTAESQTACPGVPSAPPTFGIYVRQAFVPMYPVAARAAGIEGPVRISVTYKGELSVLEGPPELADPMVVAIRRWLLSPGPFAEDVRFTFKLTNGDCLGGGPTVTVGPGMTTYEIAAKRVVACAP